jgi:hypothetical protein
VISWRIERGLASSCRCAGSVVWQSVALQRSKPPRQVALTARGCNETVDPWSRTHGGSRLLPKASLLGISSPARGGQIDGEEPVFRHPTLHSLPSSGAPPCSDLYAVEHSREQSVIGQQQRQRLRSQFFRSRSKFTRIDFKSAQLVIEFGKSVRTDSPVFTMTRFSMVVRVAFCE